MSSDPGQSWRSGASPHAQDDLDDLLGAGLDLAERQLTERGEFVPFAIVTKVDGEGLLVMADPAVVGDSPTSASILAYLFDQLVQGRGTVRASGVFYDATSAKGDVIQAELEHSEQVALAVQAPYRLDGASVDLGDLSVSRGTPRVWP